jgi:predicted HD phosphohydrolase
MTPDQITEVLDALAGLFGDQGGAEYFGEEVTQAEHMLQAGALAERDGAPAPLVAAALLHDLGHFHGETTGHDLMAGTDNRHSHTGADWLAQWFGSAAPNRCGCTSPPSATCARSNPATSPCCRLPPCTPSRCRAAR